MKKRIAWITADYFIDVDCLLVPYLQQNYADKYQIDWYVIKTANNNIPIPSTPNRIFTMKYRGKDPRIILEYMKIFKTLHLEKADIIYSDFVGVPYYYFVLSQYNKNKVPLIHAAHNVITYEVWPKALIWYVDKIFRKNQHFQFFSKFTMEYFKEHYKGKSYFYCPMTLKSYGNVQTNNYHIDDSKLNLLFFGNVVGNKRLDLLISAIKHLPNQYRDMVHLNICGKCNNPSPYLKSIQDMPNITAYFKRIDDHEVAELFTKHDFLMLPYQDVAQSGPHMIAYQYNLPVIASDIDGFTERVIDGENGFLFKVNDREDLTRVIEEVVNMKPQEYKCLKENLKKYSIENFSLEKISKKYIDYFELILK
ncbi:MAG: glycosyltransferase family 4 protein [Bacteroidales bacterium]|nr:glycosyltransferase family 4 protein [Bacteroidales bacterium]